MDNTLSINMFDIGRKLGEGRFGQVFLVQMKETNLTSAIKMIKKSDIQENNMVTPIQREIEIQKILCHNNILLLLGFFHDYKRIYIWLEYAPHGDVSTDIAKYGAYSNARAATYLYQLASTVNYCHSLQVMHRDIKPGNILIGIYGQIKLADFGWALHKNNSRNLNYFGTLHYRAPEVIMRIFEGYEADIWSIGVVFYEMLTSFVPFQNEDSSVIDELILNTQYQIPDFINSKAKDLIEKILQVDRNERIKLDDILNHDYLKEFSENTLDKCEASEIMWRSKS